MVWPSFSLCRSNWSLRALQLCFGGGTNPDRDRAGPGPPPARARLADWLQVAKSSFIEPTHRCWHALSSFPFNSDMIGAQENLLTAGPSHLLWASHLRSTYPLDFRDLHMGMRVSTEISHDLSLNLCKVRAERSPFWRQSWVWSLIPSW